MTKKKVYILLTIGIILIFMRGIAWWTGLFLAIFGIIFIIFGEH